MAVKSRRRAREIALRTLYEIEVGKMGPAKVLSDNLAEADLPADLEEFARTLITGVLKYQESLDAVLGLSLEDWSLDRLAVVDRTIMRIASYELYHMPLLPPAVSLNEAIDIAKKYSTEESGRFVNGVLARVLQKSPKANWIRREIEEEEVEEMMQTPEEVVEEIEVSPEEAERLTRVGGWKLRSEDQSE
jgi:transcription antitermination factor NusB